MDWGGHCLPAQDLLNGVTGDLPVHQSYNEDVTTGLLHESWPCSSGITMTNAQSDFEANVHVGINTKSGLNILATLGHRLVYVVRICTSGMIVKARLHLS